MKRDAPGFGRIVQLHPPGAATDRPEAIAPDKGDEGVTIVDTKQELS
jgi:hypothetical protein